MSLDGSHHSHSHRFCHLKTCRIVAPLWVFLFVKHWLWQVPLGRSVRCCQAGRRKEAKRNKNHKKAFKNIWHDCHNILLWSPQHATTTRRPLISIVKNWFNGDQWWLIDMLYHGILQSGGQSCHAVDTVADGWPWSSVDLGKHVLSISGTFRDSMCEEAGEFIIIYIRYGVHVYSFFICTCEY